MHYYICLLNKEESKDGLKIGLSYALKKESEWIQCDEISEYLTGVAKGVDFAVKDNTSYMIVKRYCDIQNKRVIVICIETSYGCDTRVF